MSTQTTLQLARDSSQGLHHDVSLAPSTSSRERLTLWSFLTVTGPPVQPQIIRLEPTPGLSQAEACSLLPRSGSNRTPYLDPHHAVRAQQPRVPDRAREDTAS